ncbi:MAG: GIY-YIG nuclease family protein [Candidatus Dojkabacteria bacterium]
MNSKLNTPYTVYILKCSNGAFYCGVAKDLEKRLEVHRSGKGSKYVRANMPFELVYTKVFDNKIDAFKEEARIKNLKRGDKEKLFN